MKKDKLFTVNKWNKPMFMPTQHLFPNGGNVWQGLADNWQGYDDSLWDDKTTQYMNSKNAFGISKKNNPFSKGNLTGVGKAVGNAALSAGAGLIGSLGSSLISGGLQSSAGNAIGSIGSTIGGAVGAVNPVAGAVIGAGSQLLGGLANRMFGSKLNQENINAIENNINGITEAGNVVGAAQTNEDLLSAAGNMQTGFDFDNDFIGEDGWFSSKAEDKANELRRKQQQARAFAARALTTGAQNADANMDFNVMSNFAANGGKLFAGGGLKAAFFDEFGKDPIGAAVRYNQGLEALAAQEEAKQIEAAKEAEYLGMQQRLANLETQNQGLQAMLDAMPSTNPMSEAPAPSSTPSVATPRGTYNNANWDYIKDQLKKSGKFNDVQIEGIKYNLQRESGIGKYDNGDNGTARGLAQWRGDRIPKDMSLEGQTQYLIKTLSNYDGKLHWIGEDNYRGFMNARTPEEAHYYITKGYERPHKDIVAKVKRDSDMSLGKLKAFGGELGTNGTDFTNGLLYIDEGGSHEDNPLDGVPMGLDPEGIPNLVEEGETVYNDYVFSDRMKVPNFMLKDLGLPKSKKSISFADASKKLAQESEKRPNDPISKDGLQASLSRLAEIQETERIKKQAEEYMGLEEYACGGKLGNKYKGNNPKGQKMRTSNFKYDGVHADNPIVPTAAIENPAYVPQTLHAMDGDDFDGYIEGELDPNVVGAETRRETLPNGDTVIYHGKPQVKTQEQQGQQGLEEYANPKTYPTWMRYAPAAGAGIMSLTDALGITNNPDYTYADKLEGYARQAGYAPNISYKPIGNYLRYNPMDIWFGQNRMDANARATDRAIMNNAAPIGTKMAGLLASGYNNQIANGQLYRNALEYNDAKRKDVAGFNRTTDMFNSQMGLEAAMANARYQQAARQMGLSGLAQAAAMRNDIDARIGAARSANLTNFLNNLGNIGRENFAMNQINTDRSRNYYGRLNGDVRGYKRKGACGGKLNRK